MIDYLSGILENKFNYKLKDYAIYDVREGRSKVVLITTVLFLVALILFLLEIFEIFPNFMSLGIIIVLLAVLIVAPYSLMKSKYEAIIVTPKFLIERIGKQEFIVIEFDKISDFKIAKEGIIVHEGKKKIVLGTTLFQEEVEPIIDILEAKGKTFDKEKDYMIRKIIIKIEDNKVFIVDDETETETQKLHRTYSQEFPCLTPGYIGEISLRNTMIDDVMLDKDHMILYTSGFEVKGGHPENTTFDNLKAEDGIIIFESIKFTKFYRENLNDKDKPIEKFSTSSEEVIKHLSNAVITDWTIDGKSMSIEYAEGIYQLHTEFHYNEVIIGWKCTK